MGFHLHNRARVRRMQLNTDPMTGARSTTCMKEMEGKRFSVERGAWKGTLNGEPSNNKQTWLAVKANRCSSWQLLHVTMRQSSERRGRLQSLMHTLFTAALTYS